MPTRLPWRRSSAFVPRHRNGIADGFIGFYSNFFGTGTACDVPWPRWHSSPAPSPGWLHRRPFGRLSVLPIPLQRVVFRYIFDCCTKKLLLLLLPEPLGRTPGCVEEVMSWTAVSLCFRMIVPL